MCAQCWLSWRSKQQKTCPFCRGDLVHKDDVPIVVADINEHSSPEHGSKTALMVAAESGHLAIVKFLIDKDANLNRISVPGDVMSASMYAANNGHKDVFNALVDAGSSLWNSDGVSNLMRACERGREKEVKFYLESRLFDPSRKVRFYMIDISPPRSHGQSYQIEGPYSNMNAFDMAKLGYKTHNNKKAYFNIRKMLFVDWMTKKSSSIAGFFSRGWGLVTNSFMGIDVMPIEPGIAGPESN